MHSACRLGVQLSRDEESTAKQAVILTSACLLNPQHVGSQLVPLPVCSRRGHQKAEGRRLWIARAALTLSRAAVPSLGARLENTAEPVGIKLTLERH